MYLSRLIFVRKSPYEIDVGVGVVHVDFADQGELTPDHGMSDLIGVLYVGGGKVLGYVSVRQECNYFLFRPVQGGSALDQTCENSKK